MSDKTTAPNKLEIKLPLTFHHFCTRESCGSWSPPALLVPGYLYLQLQNMKQDRQLLLMINTELKILSKNGNKTMLLLLY